MKNLLRKFCISEFSSWNSITFSILGSGASWSQLFVNPTPDEPLTLGHFIMMLIIDVIIFAIITWYVEAVNPGFDGVPQKPYFFLQVNFTLLLF